MDHKITNYNAATEEVCLKQVSELPIDADFLVADYLGEIKKVLKCRITPYISSKQVSGNALITEGNAVISVIYTDPSGALFSAEQEVPFKKTFEVNKVIDGGFAEVFTEATVHSCRAVTERKFSIKASVKLDATVTVIEKNEIISDIDSDCFELLKGEASATTPLGISEKTLVIDEEILLPQSLPSSNRIIRSDASATVTDCKIISDKVIVKGNLLVEMLYCTTDGDIKKHTANIPFNQIIDIAGISEFCECESRAAVCGLNISSRTSEDGECRSFMLVCKLNISVSARCSNSIPVLYDVYSTRYPTKQNTNDVRFNRIIKQVNERFLCKKSLSSPENTMGKVTDLWCKLGSVNARREQNGMIISGSLNAFVLTSSADGEHGFFERIIDFEYPVTLDGELNEPTCRPEISIEACDFAVGANGEAELKVELMITAAIYDSTVLSLITNIEVDENSPISNDASLIAYYADKGENVWEISKTFLANRSELLEINHLTDEIVQNPKMLLIPLM